VSDKLIQPGNCVYKPTVYFIKDYFNLFQRVTKLK